MTQIHPPGEVTAEETEAVLCGGLQPEPTGYLATDPPTFGRLPYSTPLDELRFRVEVDNWLWRVLCA